MIKGPSEINDWSLVAVHFITCRLYWDQNFLNTHHGNSEKSETFWTNQIHSSTWQMVVNISKKVVFAAFWPPSLSYWLYTFHYLLSIGQFLQIKSLSLYHFHMDNLSWYNYVERICFLTNSFQGNKKRGTFSIIIATILTRKKRSVKNMNIINFNHHWKNWVDEIKQSEKKCCNIKKVNINWLSYKVGHFGK